VRVLPLMPRPYVVDSVRLGLPRVLEYYSSNKLLEYSLISISGCKFPFPVQFNSQLLIFYGNFGLRLLYERIPMTIINSIVAGRPVYFSLTKTWRAKGPDDGPERKWPVGVDADGRRRWCRRAREEVTCRRWCRPIRTYGPTGQTTGLADWPKIYTAPSHILGTF